MPPNNRHVSYLQTYAKKRSNSKPKRTKASIHNELNAARLNLKKASDVLSVKTLGDKIGILEEELNDYNNNNNNNNNNAAAKKALEESKKAAKEIEDAFQASQRAAASSNLELSVLEQQPNENENENDPFKRKEAATPITEHTSKITDDMIDHLHTLIRNEPQRIKEEKGKGKNIDTSPVFNYIRTVIQPEYPTYKTKNGIHMRYSVSDIYKQMRKENPSLNHSIGNSKNIISHIQRREINTLGGRKTHRKRKTLRKSKTLRRHQ